jgi:hypothetical protein
VLLLHADDAAAGAERAIAREQQARPLYAAYQRVLNAHLHALAAGGRFAQVIVAGDRPVLEVQQELRVMLRDRIGVSVPAVALRRVQVLGLAGLSESGKSTAGDYLASRNGYARLKIGYLLETAAGRQGVADVYALSDTGLAELLVAGLEAYCAAHHFQRHVSIESLHRAGMTAELRKLLGGRLTVVDLDASHAVRQARSAAGAADVRQRDAVKRSRGAHQIRDLADVVTGNDGPRVSLYRSLDSLAVARRWPSAVPRRADVADLGLPGHLPPACCTFLPRSALGGSRCCGTSRG